MFQKLFFFLCICLIFCPLHGFSFPDPGHRIEIKVKGHELDTLYLGYHLGDKQYIRDTIVKNGDGVFIAKGDKTLEGGIYMIILPPENRYFEILVGGPDDQHFSVETDAADMVSKAKFKGSEENSRFFEYLSYINANKAELEKLKAREQEEKDQNKLQKIHASIDELNEAVTKYQLDIIEKYPASLLSAIIKLTMPPDIPSPEKEMTEEEESQWRFHYYKAHFFDPLNFGDDRLLRTPLFQSKIEQYVNNMTVRHPDSIVVAVDYILEKAKLNEEVFKYGLMHFLNKYAKSKIVGMDAVYVHLVDKYYATGQAPWVTEEVLKKMTKRARELRPLLIGKRAPNILIKTFEKKPTSLYEVKSPFTILYFWDPKCGHCNKVAPDMVKFYEDFKDKGVRIFSVCTKDRELEACAEAVKEKGFTDWINTIAIEDKDLYYRLNYSIKSTPVIYILDEEKTIISKNIGATQLPEVLDMFIKQREEGK